MTDKGQSFFSFSHLSPFEAETLSVIIETPQGSRNKYDFDPARGLFLVSDVLTLGAAFPFDFGFIPNTLGEDGDPLDVLVLMEEPTFTGCFVACRLVGVIEAEQTEKDGKTERNDRLLAVALHSHTYREVHSLDDLDAQILQEIEHFFISYNQAKGKEFCPAGRSSVERARRLIKEGLQRAEDSNSQA